VRVMLLLLMFLLPTSSLAAETVVTPEMRRVMAEKLTQNCLQRENEFLKKGFTKAQTAVICSCAMQQTAALLNSRTVSYILEHGVMPQDMQRKVASATVGCMRSR
jgi:hypothetical protein